MLFRRKKKNITYFAHNLLVVIGLVLMWRGVWHILDSIDATFFGGQHFYTSVLGVLLGLVVLYLPDKDLKEIA